MTFLLITNGNVYLDLVLFVLLLSLTGLTKTTGRSFTKTTGPDSLVNRRLLSPHFAHYGSSLLRMSVTVVLESIQVKHPRLIRHKHSRLLRIWQNTVDQFRQHTHDKDDLQPNEDKPEKTNQHKILRRLRRHHRHSVHVRLFGQCGYNVAIDSNGNVYGATDDDPNSKFNTFNVVLLLL